MLKTCIVCGKEKELTSENFPVNRCNKDGFAGKCKICMADYKKNYRIENAEKIADKGKRYWKENADKLNKQKRLRYIDNSDEIKRKQSIYRKENREEINAKLKKYRKENVEKYHEYTVRDREINSIRHKRWNRENADQVKAYTIRNKDTIAENRRIYCKANKDKVNIRSHNYRAKKRELPSTLTIEQWKNVKQHFDNKCAYCGEQTSLAQDHFYPLHLGGEYSVSNIICACIKCNGSKGARIFTDWYPRQPYYSESREKKILSYLKYINNSQQLAFA